MSLEVLCAVVNLFCAIVLITHCKYEEGIVGRLALLMIILSEIVVITTNYYDDAFIPSPITVLRHVAITLFLSRHTYKFLMFQYFGRYVWDRRSNKNMGQVQ